MDSDNITREVARFSNGFHTLIELLVKELDAHIALIARLETRIIDLEQKGSQSVSIKIDGDIGERLDELEQRLNDELHSEEDIREWAKDEAQDVLANASFSVTVD